MKYLLPLFILLTISVSCKKKEINNTPISVSKGDFLILVVSDSLECAMEYREDLSPSSSLKESPVSTTAELFDGNYNVTVYMSGTGAYGYYEQNVPSFKAWDFPVFYESYPDTFVDSIPGHKLDQHAAYQVILDTSRVDFLMNTDPGKLEDAWDKVKNLRLVFEYRKKFPSSKIAFLHVVKENGEAKSYFFINKYKP